MGRLRGLVAATVAACLLLASCTTEDPTPTPTASAASLGRSGVTSPDGWEGTVTIAAPPASAPLLTDTKALLDAGLLVGMPLEITADQALPAQGLTITRTYPVPLGADMASTLAFFNDDAGGWQAVPSILSPDRRTVSAVVTHLSVWNDIVAGTQQSVSDFRSAAGDAVRAGSELSASALSAAAAKLADVADWMYYAVGKVFDTRVDAPVCDSTPPSWVREVVFIEDHRNNPIRFCSGRDGTKPDLLVVKARVNRGFAFAAKPAVKTAWQYNSSETTGLWDAVLPWLEANDEALRDTLLEVTGGDPRLAVGAGQELSLGLSDKDTRAVKGSTVLELQPPDAVLFLYSLLGQLIMQDIGLKDTSALTTALALSSCISSVAEADRDDPLKIAKAVLVCLQSQSETITKLTVRIMTDTGRDAAQTLSTARVLTRASIYLALIGPVFSTMNWVAETKTLKNARTIDVFPTTVARSSALLQGIPAHQVIDARDDFADGSVGFSSPSGKLSCGIIPTGSSMYAECQGGSAREAPDDDDFCESPGDFGIGGVMVAERAGWYCAGGLVAGGSLDQAWWVSQGFSTTKGMSGMDEAVLPYGWAIKVGQLVCVSRETGVSCGNTTTGASFSTNQSATQFTGPTYERAADWNP